MVRVIDGDTMVVRLDLGRYGGGDRVQVETTIRVAGFYASEMRWPEGQEAKRYALSLLYDDNAFPEPPVIVQTRKPNPRDPYGRVVADVWLDDGRPFAEAMIEAGHGHA